MGICGNDATEIEFYVDDIHVVKLEPHSSVMDFESTSYSNQESINLSMGTAEVSANYNHTNEGSHSLRVMTNSFDHIAGNTRPQFNLTDAAGTPIRVKAGAGYLFSFWFYVPESSAVSAIRYWLTVTESTVGYTDQKDNERIYETSNIVGAAGQWTQVAITLNDLPRDGYLRLGICGNNATEIEFYVDDIHVMELDNPAIPEDYEDYATEDIDFIHNGDYSISTSTNHTVDGGRSLRLGGVSWGGLNRNQLTLVDPATREPYVLENGVYYTLSMWVYTVAEGFSPNVWLWPKDAPYTHIPTDADKTAMADQFLYDGKVEAQSDTGLLKAGEWTRITMTFLMKDGPYLLMGMTDGAVQGGGYNYYLDDVQVAPALPSVITVMDGETGEPSTYNAYVGLNWRSALSIDLKTDYELIGVYYDAEYTRPLDWDSDINDTAITLYTQWRPCSGVCHHTHSCDTVCRICGKEGVHQPGEDWKTDAAGHWRVCTLCGAYVTGDDHTYAADCDGTCEVCGYERGHSHTMVAGYTATGHYTQCSLCGEATVPVAHTYTDVNDDQCNDCGYVRYTTGDLDRDGDVDEQDVLTLAYHLFLPEHYPFYQQADFNRDGRVNSDDALYLQHHLEDPVSYPLAIKTSPILAMDDDVYTLS